MIASDSEASDRGARSSEAQRDATSGRAAQCSSLGCCRSPSKQFIFLLVKRQDEENPKSYSLKIQLNSSTEAMRLCWRPSARKLRVAFCNIGWCAVASHETGLLCFCGSCYVAVVLSLVVAGVPALGLDMGDVLTTMAIVATWELLS